MPSEFLAFINHHLADRYTNGTGSFVTAFSGVYDPHTRSLTYASAGHPTMRLRHGERSRCERVESTRHPTRW